MSDRPVIIGTRGSPLALAQANCVVDQLRVAFPQIGFEVQIIKTTGDTQKSASLRQVGESSKGLFTKELEQALLRGQIDLAIHSCKDLPGEIPAGLIIAAVPLREDARDVFISKRTTELPAEGVIATSSVRRKAQLLAHRPALQVVEIRGNVETRLGKLAKSKDWQGILLAAAGLKRLRILDVNRSSDTLQFDPPLRYALLPFDVMLPAVGQAALAIETRANDSRIASMVAPLNHAASFSAVSAERAFLKALGGGCQTPMAAHATLSSGKLRLRGAVFNEDGTGRRSAELIGSDRDPESIGIALAEKLG